MSIELVLFSILAAMAIGSALMVITRKSAIAASMFLVMHFVTLGGLYLLLQAQFMAAIQILVYAGAIMVLVVFVIMLLNLGQDERITDRIRSRESLGVALSIALGGVLIYAVSHTFRPEGTPIPSQSMANGTVQGIGQALFTTYVFPFEMVSLVLLAAAVGAVVLTKRHLS